MAFGKLGSLVTTDANKGNAVGIFTASSSTAVTVYVNNNTNEGTRYSIGVSTSAADIEHKEYVRKDNYLNRPEAWKIALGRCPNTDGAIGMIGADYPYPEGNAVGKTPYPMTGAMKAT